MAAASIWSLLIPAAEQSSEMGKWSFLPAEDNYAGAGGDAPQPGGKYGRGSGLRRVALKCTEEKWLKNLYGREYEVYCQRVNRCIPWLPKSGKGTCI